MPVPETKWPEFKLSPEVAIFLGSERRDKAAEIQARNQSGRDKNKITSKFWIVCYLFA